MRDRHRQSANPTFDGSVMRMRAARIFALLSTLLFLIGYAGSTYADHGASFSVLGGLEREQTAMDHGHAHPYRDDQRDDHGEHDASNHTHETANQVALVYLPVTPARMTWANGPKSKAVARPSDRLDRPPRIAL